MARTYRFSGDREIAPGVSFWDTYAAPGVDVADLAFAHDLIELLPFAGQIRVWMWAEGNGDYPEREITQIRDMLALEQVPEPKARDPMDL